jgi:hypothetical protein
MKNQKPNPLISEDWFVENIKLDTQVQEAKIKAFKKFQSKYYPKISAVNRMHTNYINLIKLFSSNIALSSFITIVIISTIGVSASEMLAPKEFKPSTFVFGKGYSSSSSISTNTQNSSSSTQKEKVKPTYSVTSSTSSTSSSENSITSSSSQNSSTSSQNSSSVSTNKKLENSSSTSSSPQQSLKLVPADYIEKSSIQNSSNITTSLNIELKSYN